MTDEDRKTPWLASIPVVVSDREAAKKWYVDKFGLYLLSNEGHWVTVGSDENGTQIHLCQASENKPRPIPMEPGPIRHRLCLTRSFSRRVQAIERQRSRIFS